MKYQQSGVELQVAAQTTPGTTGQAQVVVVQNPNDGDKMAELMKTNGGYCWKVTLIVMWSIGLAGAALQFIFGLMFVSLYGDVVVGGVLMLLPGIIGIVGGSVSIKGAVKYNYQLSLCGCIACGLLLLLGIYYIVPFIYYSCLLGFSIVFTKKIAYIQKNGVAKNVDQDCCKNCYECCNCQQCCACC